MKHTLESLKAEVIKAGFTVSSGSCEDDIGIVAFSVETVPGTWGHPQFEAYYSKLTGWTRIGNKETKGGAS